MPSGIKDWNDRLTALTVKNKEKVAELHQMVKNLQNELDVVQRGTQPGARERE